MTTTQVDWQAWLDRWDESQAGHIPFREERFSLMLDVLEASMEGPFVALDLACGPGAISRRILERFPQASCIALDFDPVLLSIGRGAMGDAGGRLRWIDADLRGDEWAAELAGTPIDCVLSTTALHWLKAGELFDVYQRLATLIRSGGVFMNGDVMALPPRFERTAAVSASVRSKRRRQNSEANPDHETLGRYFENAQKEPALMEAWAERMRRYGTMHTEGNGGIGLHTAALEEAGFREVSTVWQDLQNRILLAVR